MKKGSRHGSLCVVINKDGSYGDGRKHLCNDATVFQCYSDAYNYKKRLAKIVAEDDNINYYGGYASKQKVKEFEREALNSIVIIRLV